MKFFTFHFNWQSLFHLVWFHCIQRFLHSRLLLRALRPFSTLQNIVTKFTKCFKGCYCPSYRIVAEFSKCFKGCYCPLRHIKNLMETITEALTRKIFNSLTFNFFFMHTTQSILYILYSTHYYVIILKHGSLYKFWASETRIPQENQIKLIQHGFTAQFMKVNIPEYLPISPRDSKFFSFISQNWGRSPYTTTNHQDLQCKTNF